MVCSVVPRWSLLSSVSLSGTRDQHATLGMQTDIFNIASMLKMGWEKGKYKLFLSCPFLDSMFACYCKYLTLFLNSDKVDSLFLELSMFLWKSRPLGLLLSQASLPVFTFKKITEFQIVDFDTFLLSQSCRPTKQNKQKKIPLYLHFKRDFKQLSWIIFLWYLCKKKIYFDSCVYKETIFILENTQNISEEKMHFLFVSQC